MHEVFESVARYFSVLGEPTRLRILHALCQGERCVNDIIKVAGLAQANGSRHLGLMYQAGLLSRRREGTQVFYKVADPMYVELCRSVILQINSRADGAARSATTGAESAAQTLFARKEARGSTRHVPSANHKEEASV
ncbi:metalloregulator ArsR/SmtB family transcription factor [Hydrogenophaga sp.]|uniref:ArsR/SmtB family transcription factor n=1 Tax=Hydrogenophaga sp. TaxID=1904254 RepID=UPI0025B9656B|nr:metalloregulator ArsR/SmtB family transcription factor [Hydrogenophaga sp.]